MAADAGLEWSRFENVDRAESGLSERLLEVAFRIPRPGGGAPQFDGMVDDDGDFVIVSLSRVEDGDISSMNEDERRSLQQALETDFGRSVFDAFVRGRRQSADVNVVEQNLES